MLISDFLRLLRQEPRDHYKEKKTLTVVNFTTQMSPSDAIWSWDGSHFTFDGYKFS